MSVNDNIGTRMKTYYEQIPKTKLMRRCPVVIRIDGKAFHSFTKGFDRPFDEVLIKSMQNTAKYLCENIPGCVLSYQQSDEISLLLIDYNKLDTAAWFDYEVQKLCSIVASMATMRFNRVFYYNYNQFLNNISNDGKYFIDGKYCKLSEAYTKAYLKGAMFDARVFNIPKDEVTNYFYWRQLDATRNSIQMVGQTNFSHTELHEKTCNMIQDMLMTQKGINWNDLPTYQKRGSCCVKANVTVTAGAIEDGETNTWTVERPHWIIDKDIPIFKGEGREYIDKLVFIGE